MRLRPLPTEDVVRLFGDPWAYASADGGGTVLWEAKILVMIPLPAPLPLAWEKTRMVSRIRCHHRIATPLKDALDEVHENAEAWASINDYAGCYAFRAQRRAHALSRHAWAIAIDLDSLDNPFGAAPAMHPGVVDVFEKHGFCWGGNFGAERQDGMHFEYADADRLAA